VKSLGLVHPDEIELERNGVRGNRRFWLVDGGGRLFNNKRNGPMVRIRPTWDEDSRVLALDFPDGSRVEGTVELGDAVAAQMYGHPHPSRRVLGPWESAVSDFVGRPLTLLYAEDHAVDRGYRGGTVSLVSRASLERLRIEGGRTEPVDGRRFRMLFEIDGVPPYEEDEWLGTQVRVGDATIVLNGDVGRCVVTSHDPDTGVTDFDTLGTLAAYRREGRHEPLPLGVYGSVVVPGRVRVGDAVEPLQQRLLAVT
jgi:MOSC domain-containing protein